MATYGHTFTSGDTVTPTKLNAARTVSDIVNADIKSDAAIAGSKIDPSFNAPAVVAVNSSSDALRITQEGSGNALLVEDSDNPDSTPLVVNNLGQIISGATTAVDSTSGLQLVASSIAAPNANVTLSLYNQSAFGNNATFRAQRARGSASAPQIVQNGDLLGNVAFRGYDGSEFLQAANIVGLCDGTPGASDMPGALSFRTTADGASNVTERMRIDSAGNVGIATTTPTAKLHVSGDAIVSANTSTDALRITQEGSGNALVVEDSANPDSTPLVVNSVGQIISGATTAFNGFAGLQLTSDSSSAPNANIVIRRCSNDSSSSSFSSQKSRGTAGALAAVQEGDVLLNVVAGGFDGTETTFNSGRIRAIVDGAVSSGIVPTAVTIETGTNNSPLERMRITSAGNVGIATTTPTTTLDVKGTVTATAFAGPLTGNVTGNLTGTASAIADGSVSTAKIVDGAVTNAKIASGVDASKLTTGTLPADRIGSDAITTARINNAAVTAAKLDGAQTGSAPIYGCRAWVNFDGTAGTTVDGEFRCTIRASGNVSKVVRNSTGNYTLHFTTAMPDTNYAAVMYNNAATGSTAGSFQNGLLGGMGDKTTTAMGVTSYTDIPSSGYRNSSMFDVIVFR